MDEQPVTVVAPVVMRHGWLKFWIKDLETNPRSQFKVHKWGVYYWLVNFPLITLLFFMAPGLWLKLGIFITLIYSIYANFATDYGSMSAAMAAYDMKVMPEIPGETAHYTESATIRTLLEENNRLTATIASQTRLLDEIHRHVAALTPQAGTFPPEGSHDR
jgi:hypothetical protein